MLIGKQYQVEGDSLNIVLSKKAKTKSGDDRWELEGYFATPQEALKHLVNLEVRVNGLKDLTTVAKKQNELYALIKSLDLGELRAVKVTPQDDSSEMQGIGGVPSATVCCNTTEDKENIPPANVTAFSKADVTAKITELAAKGMSSRAVAEELQAEGVKISHMTVARQLKQAVLL